MLHCPGKLKVQTLTLDRSKGLHTPKAYRHVTPRQHCDVPNLALQMKHHMCIWFDAIE